MDIELNEPSPSWVVHEIVRQAASAPVLVLGGGLSGRAVGKLLCDAGVAVVVLDEGAVAPAKKAELAQAQFLENFSVKSDAEQVAAKQLLFAKGFAFGVVSPGINPRSKLIETVKDSGITMLSELDFAFSFLGFPEVTVTGTNGKSTVVQLIADMLNKSGIATEAVGNIGVPLSARVDVNLLKAVLAGDNIEPQKRKCFVAELSSYQIEWLQLGWKRPRGGQVSVFLNASDDHLERHGSMEGYVAAKARLFALQGEGDWAVVNKDDPHAKTIIAVVQGNYMPFGSDKFAPQLNNCCYIDDQAGQIVYSQDEQRLTFDTTLWPLPGYHNRENLAACIAAASLCGATPEAIVETYRNFRLLPHRLETITSIDQVRYVNDSKGTNVSAVVVALETMRSDLQAGQGVVLLLGGFLKEGSWDVVRKSLESVRAIVFFGRDGKKIKELLQLPGAIQQADASDMLSAVTTARRLAQAGDVVLLSPGCSSFDAYNNFEERGDDFRRIVLAQSTS